MFNSIKAYVFNFIKRVILILRLDNTIYYEIERNNNLIIEAIIIVVISGFSRGMVNYQLLGFSTISFSIISEIIGWFLRSLFIFFIGMQILHKKANIHKIIRTIGFTYSPAILSFLGIIPYLGFSIRFILIFAWIEIVTIIATKRLFDCETYQAIIVVIMSFIPYLAFRILMLFI